MRWILTLGDFESSSGMLAVAEWSRDELTIEHVLTYDFPEARRVHGKGFTGARLHDGALYVCGFNAVYTVDLRSWLATPWLIRDDFNDLHDLEFGVDALGKSRIWVANTGMDRVEVLDLGGAHQSGVVLSEWSPPARPETDDPYYATGAGDELPVHLRKITDRVHPNSLHRVGRGVLVGRFSDQAIAWVDEKGPVLRLDGYPHDVSVRGSSIWATTTDGRIWCWNNLLESETGSPSLRLETFASTGRSGWCRGLSVHDDVLAVGLTRISRIPRVRWCERPFEETVSGLLLVDPVTGRELAFASLEGLGRHPKLFSIIPLPEDAS